MGVADNFRTVALHPSSRSKLWGLCTRTQSVVGSVEHACARFTLSDRCSDRGKTESCVVKAPVRHMGKSVLTSELWCTCVQRDTNKERARDMCSCWETIDTPPHVNHRSGVT